MLKDKDWLVRLKGLNSITVYSNGYVHYSIGKKRLFILKKSALQEIKDLITKFLELNSNNSVSKGKTLRFNDGKKKFTINNEVLYTQVWRIIYTEDNIKQDMNGLDVIAAKVESLVFNGDLQRVFNELKKSTKSTDAAVDELLRMIEDDEDMSLLINNVA